MLDKQFFKKYQKQIKWFANTNFGRRFFKIDKDCPKDKKIIKINPNSFTWIDKIDKEKIYYKTDCRSHAKFSKRLNALFMWLPFYAYRSGKIYKEKWINGEWYLAPKFGLTVSTFYSNASGDGHIYSGLSESWNTVHDAATGDTTETTTVTVYVYSKYNTNFDYSIYRGFLPFDTSSIPDDDTITDAALSVYVVLRGSPSSNGSRDMGIVQTTNASTSSLATSEYDLCGSVDAATEGATRLVILSMTLNAYNTFTLNETGLGWINKTGYTKLGMRDAWDLDDLAPTTASFGENGIRFRSSNQTGTDKDPKLVITHTSVTSFIPTITIY